MLTSLGQLPQLDSAVRICVIIPDIDIVGVGAGPAAGHTIAGHRCRQPAKAPSTNCSTHRSD